MHKIIKRCMQLLTILVATTVMAEPASAFLFGRRGSLQRRSLQQPLQRVNHCNIYQPETLCQVAVPLQQAYAPIVYPVQKIVQSYAAPILAPVLVDSYAVPIQAYGSPYYYSVAQAYQEKAYLRDVLREELRSLINGDTRSTPGHTRLQMPMTKSLQEPTGSDDLTPIELQKRVVEAYNGRANCLACHSAIGNAQGPQGKPFRLVVEDGRGSISLAKLSGDKRWKVYAMASVGEMPPAAINDAAKAMESQHLPNLLQYARQRLSTD